MKRYSSSSVLKCVVFYVTHKLTILKTTPTFCITMGNDQSKSQSDGKEPETSKTSSSQSNGPTNESNTKNSSNIWFWPEFQPQSAKTSDNVSISSVKTDLAVFYDGGFGKEGPKSGEEATNGGSGGRTKGEASRESSREACGKKAKKRDGKKKKSFL